MNLYKNRSLHHLFLNHADAWIVTMGITVGALMIHQAFSLRAWLLAFSITAGYWLAFAINDYFDADIDRVDPLKAKRNFFTMRPVGVTEALFGFGVAAVVIAPGFLQFGWRGLGFIALCFFAMWAYSAPPFRVKTRPGLDLIMHMLFVETFPYGMILVLLGLNWQRLDFVLIGLGLFASATAQIEQQLRDFELDRLEGQTFSIWIGAENALRLLKLLTLGMVIFGFYFVWDGTIPLIVLPIGLCALPAVLTRFYRSPNQSRPEWLIRLSIGLLLIYVIGLIIYSV